MSGISYREMPLWVGHGRPKCPQKNLYVIGVGKMSLFFLTIRAFGIVGSRNIREGRSSGRVGTMPTTPVGMCDDHSTHDIPDTLNIYLFESYICAAVERGASM